MTVQPSLKKRPWWRYLGPWNWPYPLGWGMIGCGLTTMISWMAISVHRHPMAYVGLVIALGGFFSVYSKIESDRNSHSSR